VTFDDHLDDGAGNDIFIFAPPGGHNRVQDFDLGADRLQLDLAGYNNVSELSIGTCVDGEAMIDFGDGGSVVLVGVHAAGLAAQDFIFDQV